MRTCGFTDVQEVTVPTRGGISYGPTSIIQLPRWIGIPQSVTRETDKRVREAFSPGWIAQNQVEESRRHELPRLGGGVLCEEEAPGYPGVLAAF